MVQSFSVKNLPAPLQQMIRPMLLISIFIHGIILVLPTDFKKSEPPKKEAKKLDTIKISELPTSKPLPLQTIPKPPIPLQPVTPPQAQVPRRQTTVLQIPSTKPTATPTPPPSQTPTPTPTKAAATPTPSASQAPTSTPTKPLGDPFSDFPQYPGTQPGSLDLLPTALDANSQHTSDTLNQVTTFFDQNLTDKGYQPKKIKDQSDIKIYQVTKGGKTQYWHLFAKQEGGTVMLLAPQPIDHSQLKQVGDVLTPEKQAFDAAMKDIYDRTVAKADYIDSGYLSNSKGQDPQEEGTIEGKTPEQIGSDIKSKLSSAGFQVTFAGSYRNGPVYKVAMSSFTIYVSVAPSQGGGGIIVVWKTSPI